MRRYKVKVAIITFHGAHNYGAVLQAYALQQYILSLDIECKIINYRSKSQRDFNSLYPKRNGIKSVIKNLLMLKYDKERRRREYKFEDFINNSLCLTDDLYEKEDTLYELNQEIDVFIARSDQVWNTTKTADVSTAYFLNFVDDNKKKIAYAVSIGNAHTSQLLDFCPYIRRFNSVSCRELSAVKIIEGLLNKEVSIALDPTLLVSGKIFKKLIGKSQFKNYILYYSLDGYNKRFNNVEELKILSKRLNKQVVILTPEWPKKERSFINVIDAGPIDFLTLISNADLICTNSFHGTALSISLRKDFWVLEEPNEFDDRKTSILKQLGLEKRMVKGWDYVNNMELNPILYDEVYCKLKLLRIKSDSFLKHSLFE